MKIFAIELKITLLILIIVASIIATGYLSYKNLSQIVQSIHKEARPDYKLIKIKEITADLTEVDNSVHLYSLTREPKYLKPYNKIISTVDKRIEELLKLQGNDTSQITNIHAISDLISERLIVWDQMLRLHSKPVEKEVFNEFYTTIEKRTTDTISPKKNNILKRFFKRKKEKEEITLGKEEVQEEVAKLQKTLNDKVSRQAETETLLLKKNNELGAKLQFLILQLEQKETESLFVKSLEAEILAYQTYRWLAVFCMASVVLLIAVLFIIFNYSRKSFQTEKILREAKTEAESLVKAKELFTANVSHELRTPMNAIYGLTEQLLLQPMEPKLKEQLTVIKKSADYLNKVVNDILDFSKIQAGKLSIETIPFNLLKVFEEVSILNQVIARQKHLDFHCSFSSNLPLKVIGDPTRLRQIVLNLLNNAFKFTDRGGVTVSVNADYLGTSSVLISVTIADTGIGIPSEKLDSVFDDYSQAEQSTSRQYGGTGLGLSIVKRLLELMDGTIKVKSKVQQGTSFTFSIPYLISNSIAIDEGEDEQLDVPDDIKQISILIADDEEFNRTLLTTIFKKWNISYECVKNGKDALKLLQESNFDIVLMDLRMPLMNGYDATKEILKNSPESKIIALTAGNYPDDINKCKDAGMVGFLLKPFSERELLNTVLTALGKKSMPALVYQEQTVTVAKNDEVNLDELYRVSNGDEKFVDEMLNLFVKTTLDGIRRMEQGVAEQNWKMVADAAHKMAPPCRHLGAITLYKNLKEMEKMETEPLDRSLAKQLLQDIQYQVSLIKTKVEQKIA